MGPMEEGKKSKRRSLEDALANTGTTDLETYREPIIILSHKMFFKRDQLYDNGLKEKH